MVILSPEWRLWRFFEDPELPTWQLKAVNSWNRMMGNRELMYTSAQGADITQMVQVDESNQLPVSFFFRISTKNVSCLLPGTDWFLFSGFVLPRLDCICVAATAHPSRTVAWSDVSRPLVDRYNRLDRKFLPVVSIESQQTPGKIENNQLGPQRELFYYHSVCYCHGNSSLYPIALLLLRHFLEYFQ